MNGRVRLLTSLAWRNVRRQARRSSLTAAAMIVGLALLMFSRSLAEGAHEDWIDAGVRLGSGHISVQSPEFRDRATIEHRISPGQIEQIQEALSADIIAAEVTATAPRITVRGLASSAAGARPVVIMGVDPELESAFSNLGDKLAEGRYLQPGDRLHAYIGTALASRLRLRLGSRLVLTAQDADGEITGQLARVAGIFQSGIPTVDEGLIHIPLTTAQEWLAAEGELTTFAIVLRSSKSVASTFESIVSRLANSSGLSVLSWHETMPELDGAVRVDDFGDMIFHGILLSIVALAIVNTVLMSVLYRVREFGVLRALGLSQVQTGSVVFIEGLILTISSGFAGMILGISLTMLFFHDGLDFSFLFDSELTMAGIVIDPIIIPTFTTSLILNSVAFITLIGVLSSFYPALHAARVDIAESMKFEA